MSARPASFWIAELGLKPHPEGGFYKEAYRSSGQIQAESLPRTMKGSRAYATAIYYLLELGQVSRFHRIESDELWFFHDGDPLEIVLFDEKEERLSSLLLGSAAEEAQSLQAVVPAQTWFGARTLGGFASFSLVSCVVAPGFDFSDFRLADASDLQRWPKLLEVKDLCPAPR